MEYDVPVLRHLEDITSEYLEGTNTGFRLFFHFSENEFFTNKVLTKTYKLNPEASPEDVMYRGPLFESAEG